MKNTTSEKYIELAFRYIAALYQKHVSPEVRERVKLESYQNESPSIRRKYYVDKMYHTLAAATRAKLSTFGHFENTKLAVRRFQAEPASVKILYYLSPLTRELAQIYAKYIALIWVMKQKKFLRKLYTYTDDLSVPNVYRSVKYTYYEGELADFIRVTFKKVNGRARYRSYRRNMESWDAFRKGCSYLLGDIPKSDDEAGVWVARKAIEVPLYVPLPNGLQATANAPHIGHNGKTLSTMLFLVRLMNALEMAGPAKMLGSKKLDDGQTVAHTCISALFTAPIFDLWMTCVPTYSHCYDNWSYFEGQEDMTGFLFGDYPLTGQASTQSFSNLASMPLDDICSNAAKVLIRHPSVKLAFNTKESEPVQTWLNNTIGPSYSWVKNIACNYFASFQYGLQAVEAGSDPTSWMNRPANYRARNTYGIYMSDQAVATPEPFALSYLANSGELNKFLAADAKELKPVLNPSAKSLEAKVVKSAANLFPNHLLRDLLMAEDTEKLFGFSLSDEPTEEEINRLADYLAGNISYVTVQYEPVLNMVSALAEELDKEDSDHLKIYTKLALVLRGYRRYNAMKKELYDLPGHATQSGTDHVAIPDDKNMPSWTRAIAYAGDGLTMAASQMPFLNEILDGKIEAAINLKNYTGRTVNADAGTRSRTTVPR